MVEPILMMDYPQVYQLNVELLTLAREEEWDIFSSKIEVYVTTLQAMLAQHGDEHNTDEKERIKAKLNALLSNENEIMRLLKRRIEVLKTNMSSLGQGTRCHQAYTGVFSATALRYNG